MNCSCEWVDGRMLVDNRSDSGVELVDYQEVETMGLETGATVCTYLLGMEDGAWRGAVSIIKVCRIDGVTHAISIS